MQRRSFLAGLVAFPVFGLQKAPRDLSMWTDYPVKLTEPIWISPFIEVNLDNGPVTIGDITFSISQFRTVSCTSPELLDNWVRADQDGDYYRHLIPLSRENQSRSEFFDAHNKNYGGLMKSFYNIQYEDTSTLWARIYGTPKELISGKGFSHEA